jgi:hypothetical protein
MGGPGSGSGYRRTFVPPTEGARRLAIYLSRQKLTLRAFAVKLGWVPSTFYRQTVRAKGHSLEFAAAVHGATQGKVDIREWLMLPRRRDPWGPGKRAPDLGL